MKAIHYQVGSVWRRWDPHIHAPGTIFYDEFGTDVTAWNEFLRRIEEAVPLIVTLGITDYYSLDNYEVAVARKKQGRLEDVALIFPNIAMRLAIGTGRAHRSTFTVLSHLRILTMPMKLRGFSESSVSKLTVAPIDVKK